ncbi:hypothetical protein [Pararhizobium sp.]|uniref:hypothetical protein n=1 Tax=Pararhizobium sp. TaxID=1977563 RepID=UPI0027218C18|nr:hypothetical protein [Pararhizobium sp.]MDO9414774.1 hypothetical protein [Pararhizobium sp.]
MQAQVTQVQGTLTPVSSSQQLRPVVITVIAAKLAVFALLMMTVNAPAPFPSQIEMAELR